MIPRGVILALDLGTTAGFAVGRDGEKPVWGYWPLGGQDDSGSGRRYSLLAGSLQDAIAVHRPSLVIYEAPAGRRGGATTRLLFGYTAVVEMVCQEDAVRYREAHIGSVRKLVLGHGRPAVAPGAHPKSPILDWCAAQGWAVESHDAADALVLLRYTHILSRSRAMA